MNDDPDVKWLFDHAVEELVALFDYPEASARALAVDYYRKFRDPGFCASIGIPTQDEEFFFHEAPRGLALRIHYYLGLQETPDPGAFVEWRDGYNRARVSKSVGR